MTEKRETALQIVKKLQRHGFKAYFVGGCVRDELLKIKPLDYDVATSAKAEEVINLFKKTIPVGVQFGVVRVAEKNFEFEVATFRKDGLYLDHRRPTKVFFSSAKEDVRRRDFTINGLLYDPLKEKLLDFVGGAQDIKDKTIRAIGKPQARFKEDKLRLLRAIRFAARFNYRIEKNTWQAILKTAKEINSVSAERIREELTKIFISKNNDLGLELLARSTLLEHLLPEVSAMQGIEQPVEFHPEGDVFTHTKIALSLLKNPSKELAWATLLHDIGKPLTITYEDRIRFNCHCEVGAELADKILKKLRFSNNSRKKAVKYIKNHLRFKDVRKMRVNKLKRFLREETFLDELELHRVDCLASHKMLQNWEFCKDKLKEYKSTKELKKKPLLNGHDLIKMGYKQGPLFKKILKTVEDALLENKISAKQEARELVKKKFPSLSNKSAQKSKNC